LKDVQKDGIRLLRRWRTANRICACLKWKIYEKI